MRVAPKAYRSIPSVFLHQVDASKKKHHTTQPLSASTEGKTECWIGNLLYITVPRLHLIMQAYLLHL